MIITARCDVRKVEYDDIEITQALSRVLSKYTKTVPEPQDRSPAPVVSVADSPDLEAIVARVLATDSSAVSVTHTTSAVEAASGDVIHAQAPVAGS